MKRGKIVVAAAAPLGVGSATSGEPARTTCCDSTPSLALEATSAAVGGSLGATAGSSETVTTSSPFVLLTPSVGATTSSPFLFRGESAGTSMATGGTLA